MTGASPETVMERLGGTSVTHLPEHHERGALFDPWEFPTPPSFPMSVLPPVLRTFAQDRALIIGADPGALAWAAISACSAAIDGRVRLRMKRNDNWTVPPSIWVALIGRSSTKKTPIIDAAWEALHRAQAADMRAWSDEQQRWKVLPKGIHGQMAEPILPRRLVTHDATPEAVQEILGRQARGIAVLRDELAGWIGGIEKYSHGRGSALDRAFWLQAHNGSPYVVDRIARGNIAIENLLVTICGGIQPDRLQQFGDLTDDGLWQRFVPIIVGPARMGCDEFAGLSTAAYADTIDRLLALDGALEPQLSVEAQAIRMDVERRAFELEQNEALGARFASFCGKLHGLWGRLALILACVDPQPAPYVVGAAAASAARSLIFDNVVPNAARVYAATGGSGSNDDATRSIAGYILTRQATRIVASDLTSNVRHCRGRSLEDVQRLVSPLVAGGWLEPEQALHPIAWNVDPAVHRQFAFRACQEAKRREAIRNLITGSPNT